MRLTEKHDLKLRYLPIIAALGVFGLGGCSTSRIVLAQGYIIDESLVSSVQVGVDNKSSVERTLGRPTLASQFDSNEWYYISRNSEQLAFLAPKAKTQSVIIVSFNAAGTVTKVQRDGLDKIANVGMNGDKTPTLGKDTGILQDLFGNIGQVGAVGGGPGGDTGGSGRDGPR